MLAINMYNLTIVYRCSNPSCISLQSEHYPYKMTLLRLIQSVFVKTCPDCCKQLEIAKMKFYGSFNQDVSKF